MSEGRLRCPPSPPGPPVGAAHKCEAFTLYYERGTRECQNFLGLGDKFVAYFQPPRTPASNRRRLESTAGDPSRAQAVSSNSAWRGSEKNRRRPRATARTTPASPPEPLSPSRRSAAPVMGNAVGSLPTASTRPS